MGAKSAQLYSSHRSFLTFLQLLLTFVPNVPTKLFFGFLKF